MPFVQLTRYYAPAAPQHTFFQHEYAKIYLTEVATSYRFTREQRVEKKREKKQYHSVVSWNC